MSVGRCPLAPSDCAPPTVSSQTDDAPDDGFVVVSRSRRPPAAAKRRGKRGRPAAPKTIAEILDGRRSDLNRVSWLEDARRWLGQLLSAKFPDDAPRRIVCLGLGSFRPSGDDLQPLDGLRRSQYQLLLLTDVLMPVLKGDCCVTGSAGPITIDVYDPAFSEGDKAFLRECGCEPLDEEPELRVEQRTLFYMPHAPRRLYESLLAANAPSPNQQPTAENVLLLGNSLKEYLDDCRSSTRERIPMIENLGPGFTSLELPYATKLEKEIGNGVFNQTSLQWI